MGEKKQSFLVVSDAPKVGDSHFNAPISKETNCIEYSIQEEGDECWIKTIVIIYSFDYRKKIEMGRPYDWKIPKIN